MARTIQSPGVEIKEIDLSLRPNLPVGTTVFVPGFASQGPTDELLTVTSLSEFEQIYGLPTNAAERYMYHSIKAIFQSPANLLVTRLPYGMGDGATFADNASVLVYPVVPRPKLHDLDTTVPSIYKDTRKVVYVQDDVVDIATDYEANVEDVFIFDTADDANYSGYTAMTIKEAVDLIISDLDVEDTLLSYHEETSSAGEPGFLSYGFSATSLANMAASAAPVGDDSLLWTPQVEGDQSSMAAKYLYHLPVIGKFMSELVNTIGWDLKGSDRFYLGEPSNIELNDNQFQSLLKGEVVLKTEEAGKAENQRLRTYDDLVNKGGVGMMIINNKKFIINEKFEGYYVGISDNTNLNPATDFDSVGSLKSLSKKLGGTSGGYVTVPDEASGTLSRLTFSLSSGTTFDAFGNRKQVGLSGSISEVLENLSEVNIGTDEYTDILSIGIFKIRQSTLEADASKLDFILSESIVGSFNHFREKFLSSGGAATSFSIESEAEQSPNLTLRVNEGISKFSGNWQDEEGIPEKKVRVFPAKDVRNFKELVAEGENPTRSEDITNSIVSQNFLNEREEAEDRQYLRHFQKLVSIGRAQIKDARSMYPHGVYRKQVAKARELGNIPAKLERVFELADNFDLFPIDITIEAGLGTVYVGSKGGTDDFDEEAFVNIGNFATTEGAPVSGNGLYTTKVIDNRSSIDYLTQYDTIFDTFKNFSQFQRKDNLFIADPLRWIFVQGRNNKILTSENREKGVNFSQHIYWPLRHTLTGGTKNSNYCCSYATWAFTSDKVLNRGVWVPFSGFAAANMGNTDSNFYPWFAPAGFTRGLLSGMTDLAFYPKQKERDQLYTIGLNPVANFPNEGFVIFGQKTMQAKPSAFDRINVRRLFLYLQKAVLNTVKYFVFEPNTLFTRTQVLNVLRPIFEEVKNTQGMYDYLLVCDERNNTPEVIDRNELVIDIYIKPTRAAEFILVNFYATRTGQDFSELVG